MRTTSRLILALICALALVASGAAVSAQDSKQEKEQVEKVERDVIVERHKGVFVEHEGDEIHLAGVPQMMFSGQDDGDVFFFVSSEMSIEGKLVKGAPYSAQAVTESVQTLADGNRIVHKTTASVYRDSEGRTRRDQTLGPIGPWQSSGDAPHAYFINDPVAGVNYIVMPGSRTARKIERFDGDRDLTAEAAPGEARPRFRMRNRAPRERAWRKGPPEGEGPRAFTKKLHEPKTETLAKQFIEGVEAEGTRTTITIPAGEIGNELPINIVTERWYSPELQVVVMSKHSDPRMGETTYRLTNINRSEPDRSLFEVPADITIKEGHARRERQIRKRRAND